MSKMMLEAALSLALPMILLLSGCSFNKVQIHKPYRPVLQRMEGTRNHSVSTTVRFHPVFAHDPTVVGINKNIRGRETARVHLSEEVEVWLKNGFENELQMAGFRIAHGSQEDHINITLNVEQFFVEPWVGLWSCQIVGIMKVEVVLETPGSPSCYVRRFVSYDRSSMPRHAYRFVSLGVGMIENKVLGVAQRTFEQVIHEIQRLVTERQLL